jgi:hypothetical protein
MTQKKKPAETGKKTGIGGPPGTRKLPGPPEATASRANRLGGAFPRVRRADQTWAPPKPSGGTAETAKKKQYRRPPRCPQTPRGHRKRLSRAQIAWGERFHAPGVPVRRGRHRSPVAAPPKPDKKAVSAEKKNRHRGDGIFFCGSL